MKQSHLKGIIRRITDLPTLPLTVMKITELINNPRTSAKDLAAIINDDQVLTARLLKLVNSSFYGFPQRISTVTAAVVLIGFDAIRDLLLSTSIFDLFNQRASDHRVESDKLWDHSLGCAVAAKIIGNYLRYEKVEELFVCGLLHDIGKIVEMLFLKEDFNKVTTEVTQKNILILTAENQVLGYNHAEVGGVLAQNWNLPPKIVKVIALHHQPDQAERFLPEAAIIHLADILCRALNIGSGWDNKVPPLNETAWQSLQLGEGAIESIMTAMEKELQDVRLFV